MAWRDLGVMFEQGVSEIRFSLNPRPDPLHIDYTVQGFHRLQERIQGPQLNIRTIEGRLLMIDLKEHGTRCRIHPSIGDPSYCLIPVNTKKGEPGRLPFQHPTYNPFYFLPLYS
jgi:hypothetical protein